MTKHFPNQLKNIFTDTIWSISGLVLMNMAAQFIVYPYWNRTLGSEAYGNIVYLIAIMNIMAISVGSGINYTRMRQSAESETHNNAYLILMAVGTGISLLFMLLLQLFGFLHLKLFEFLSFCLLTTATMWRYYADVEYRLHVDYKGYFAYYLIIGVGYLLGIPLYKATGAWPLTLLLGEIMGLVMVFFRGSIFRKSAPPSNEVSPKIAKLALMLVCTNVLSHLIFNGDKIVLKMFAGGIAVTNYYISSLFGKTMTFVTTPLNGVLVGHLAKYKGKLTHNLMCWVTGIAIISFISATAVCGVASNIILPLLYPTDYTQVKPFIWIASAAQVEYFIGNVLMGSVLLRFTKPSNQLLVNVVHGILFIIICIPLAWGKGIEGFCWGLLGVNLARLTLCVLLGYFED